MVQKYDKCARGRETVYARRRGDMKCRTIGDDTRGEDRGSELKVEQGIANEKCEMSG